MEAVTLSQVMSVSYLLYKEKEFHVVMAGFYHTLFNSLCDPEADPVEVAKNEYDAVRQFYQQQAVYHQCRVLRMSAKIEQYEGAVDKLSAPL